MDKGALQKFLNRPAPIVAAELLGCILEREVEGRMLRVRIVETEAYDETDAASHSYKGRTQRTDVMFGPSGYLYVYFTYGMHYCCNVVTGGKGVGSAVLIRAVEPIDGEEYMSQLRNRKGVELTNGPAKLCQALAIDKRLNGHDLTQSPVRLVVTPGLQLKDITQTVRVGISQAKEVPWRFYVKQSTYVSKP